MKYSVALNPVSALPPLFEVAVNVIKEAFNAVTFNV
jgi:hypothetical protein